VPSEERIVDSNFAHFQGAELSEVVNPLSGSLAAIATDIAAELHDQLDEIVERWYAQMEAIPELVSWRRPDIRGLILPHAKTDIGRELRGLVDGGKLPSTCPQEVAISARMAAANGLPMWAALQVYRIGHATQWQAWSDAVELRAMEPTERRALLRAGSDYFFAYADRCVRWVEAEYTRERDIPLRRAEQQRVQLVARLLEGRSGDASQLGYELDQWHVGIVAAGPDAEHMIQRLGERSGASALSVAVEASAVWIWLGLPVGSAELRDAIAELDTPADVAIALGEPGHGTTGFRRTHLQAQRARCHRRAAPTGGHSLCRHRAGGPGRRPPRRRRRIYQS
jgi:GGDEF-like domain